MNAPRRKEPLSKHLGIKPGFTLSAINPPPGYLETLMAVPLHAQVITHEIPDADIIHFFAESRAILEETMPRLRQLLGAHKALWISWPKAETSDLTTALVQSIGQEHGFSDVKIGAIDEVWSGMKFVYNAKKS